MPISCHPTTLKRTEEAILASFSCQPACPTAAAMLHSSRMALDHRSRFNERWATLSKEAFETIVNTILDKMTTLPTIERAALPANFCAAGTRSDVIAGSPPPANSQLLVQSCSPGGALCQQNSGVNDCCIQGGDIIGSYAAAAAQISVERWSESVGCDSMVTKDSRKAGKRFKEADRRQRSDHRQGLQVTGVTVKKEGAGKVLSLVGADIAKCEHKHCCSGDSPICSCIGDDWPDRVIDAPTDITLLGGGSVSAAVVTAATTAASVAAVVSVATTAAVGVNEQHTPRRRRPIFEASDGGEIDSSGWAGGMAAASAQCIKCGPVVSGLDEVVRRQDAHQWVRLSKSTLFNLVEELVAATAEEREGSGGRVVSPREACTPPFRCDDRRQRRSADKCREISDDMCRDLSSESGGIMSPAIGRLNFVKREPAGSPPLAPVLVTGKRQCWAAVNKAVVFTVFDQAIQSDCRRISVADTPPCLYRNGMIHGSPSIQSDSDESSVLDLSSKENIQKLIDDRSPNNPVSPSDDPGRFNGTASWKPNSKRRSTDAADASRRGKKRKRGSAHQIVRTWEDRPNDNNKRDTSDVDKSPSPPLRNSRTGSASPCSGVDVNCNRKQVGAPPSEVSECDGHDSASLSPARTPRTAAPTDADDTAARPTPIVCTESQRCRNSRESPKLGWVAVSQDEVHTIVDTVVGTMLTPRDTNTASFPTNSSPCSVTTRSPSPLEPSSAASLSPNIPRPQSRDRRSPDSRQTGNDLDIGELAIYSEGEDEKTSSHATDSDPDTAPNSADTDTSGDCSPKRGFKWKSNLLMRMREEGKTEGSDVEQKVETQDDCDDSKDS